MLFQWASKGSKPIQLWSFKIFDIFHKIGWWNPSEKIISEPLFTIISKLKNDNFKTRDFSPLIKRVLAGVCKIAFCIYVCNHYALYTINQQENIWEIHQDKKSFFDEMPCFWLLHIRVITDCYVVNTFSRLNVFTKDGFRGNNSSILWMLAPPESFCVCKKRQ